MINYINGYGTIQSLWTKLQNLGTKTLTIIKKTEESNITRDGRANYCQKVQVCVAFSLSNYQ